MKREGIIFARFYLRSVSPEGTAKRFASIFVVKVALANFPVPHVAAGEVALHTSLLWTVQSTSSVVGAN